jgi:hypothetical protein
VRTRLLLTIICLMILTGSACAPEETQNLAGSFDALTYNVAGLPQGISSSDPERYIPQISALLNPYDLVLVQEDFSYHDDLVRDLVHPYRSVPKVKSSAYVNDGLNRFAKFPWQQLDRQQWVSCFGDADTGSGDCLAEKGFSLAQTEVAPTIMIDIYNLHVEAGGGEEDISAREAGIAQFIEYVLANSKAKAIIIGGDTNLHRDDPADVPLLDDILQRLQVTDACETVACGIDSIDRFYYRSNDRVQITPTSWRYADEFVDDEGNDLSDHKAVHVSFSFKEK